MLGLAKPLAAMLVVAAACASLPGRDAYAAQAAPIGAWRTTNECFLAVFVLSEDGRAQAGYLSGEKDENAAWTWDGSTLTITSQLFALDRFAAHLSNDRLEADYVWHDLDRDVLTQQSCVFERLTPSGA